MIKEQNKIINLIEFMIEFYVRIILIIFFFPF